MPNQSVEFLLTRPLAQSDRFARQLRNRFGEDIAITQAPLLEIHPVKATLRLENTHTLMFTSINGVTEFTKLSDRRDIPCLCVGQRTARLAIGYGFTAVSADGNADALLAMALKEPVKAGHFLHVRGRHTVRSLKQALQDNGREAAEVILYEQLANVLTIEATALLVPGHPPVILPLFSPRTAAVFMSAAYNLDLAATTAICLSQNVAHALDARKFAAIKIAAQPTAPSVIESIAAII